MVVTQNPKNPFHRAPPLEAQHSSHPLFIEPNSKTAPGCSSHGIRNSEPMSCLA